MSKREFIKAGLLAGLVTKLPIGNKATAPVAGKRRHKLKNWVWASPDLKDAMMM